MDIPINGELMKSSEVLQISDPLFTQAQFGKGDWAWVRKDHDACVITHYNTLP